MPLRTSVLFYLNGTRCEVTADHAHMMLADYLRYQRGLTGTKIVCAEGDCGACSVLILKRRGKATRLVYEAINSCITTVAQLDGSNLVTVDALAKEELTPTQAAMVNCHGSQCGFCTPGFVVALSALIDKKLLNPQSHGVEAKEAKNALTGNLCRCTGYQPIIDAASGIDLKKCEPLKNRFYDPKQEKDLRGVCKQPVLLETAGSSFYAPITLKDAVKYLARNSDARIVAGGTDLGVLHNKRKIRFQKLLSLHLVPELYEINKSGSARVSVGARVTLSELRRYLEPKIPEFARFLDLFASPQIKNVATLVGNVANASPIAEAPPFLLVANAEVEIVGPRGKRKLPLHEYFVSYRKTALKTGELISAISFDVPAKTESLSLYKTSQRKDLDISAVNAAFRVSWKDTKKSKIGKVQIAMGGVAAIPLRLTKTEKSLNGKQLSKETLAQALLTLHEEMNPISDLRGSSSFRRVMVENLFNKFFREVESS